MLISFSGLDGAGKSTLIAWLRGELERRRRRVAVLHMNDDVTTYALARRLRDRLLRRPAADGPPRMDPHPAGLGRLRDAVLWSPTLRRLLYPLDLLLFLAMRAWLELLGGRVLIMDRYFYDSLVDVADGRRWRWLRALARLTPEPDVPILLEISPEEAFARKGEYTVAYLRARAAHYGRVFPWVRRPLRLPALHLEDAKRAIADAVLEPCP